MKQQIEVAAKLYECQGTAKRFFRDGYMTKINPYLNIIKAHQKKFGLEVLPSVLELCGFESVRDNGMATMLFMAAAVELIENKEIIS